MASFETVSKTIYTWINQSTYSSELDDRDEFIVEFPSYDSSPIYLLDSDLKDTFLNRNYSITSIKLLNDTDSFNNFSSNLTRFDSFFLFLQGDTVANTLSILLAIFLYTLSLLTILGNYFYYHHHFLYVPFINLLSLIR